MCCSGDGKRCKKTVEKIGGVFCTQKQTLTVAELLQRNDEYPLVDVEKETFSPPPAWMTDDLLIISDTHFFEKDRNVYPRRVPGWKKLIIQNWNKAVRDGQVILHLGDLYYGNKKYGQELLGALKGCKRLLLGNHGEAPPAKAGGFQGAESIKKSPCPSCARTAASMKFSRSRSCALNIEG